jgi:NAD(P)-dependent dehydrogenase (short-subunit alcohol dehydrogenase family)
LRSISPRLLRSDEGSVDPLFQGAQQPARRQGHSRQCGSPGNTYFEGGIWQTIERGNPDLFKTAMSLNPTRRMGTAEEVAAGVVFLASPVASRVSGTNLIIDGALTKGV